MLPTTLLPEVNQTVRHPEYGTGLVREVRADGYRLIEYAGRGRTRIDLSLWHHPSAFSPAPDSAMFHAQWRVRP